MLTSFKRACSAVELLQFGVYRGIELAGWYDILNIGYRFPCVGASDYPACRKLGDCQTYVSLERSSRFCRAGSKPPRRGAASSRPGRSCCWRLMANGPAGSSA